MRLNLVVLYCADIEASRRFYELLGLSFVREKHGAGPEHFAATIHEVVLELYPGGGDTSGSRRTRIGFQAGDREAIVGALRAAGIEVKDRDGFSIVQDPDGHPVHLND